MTMTEDTSRSCRLDRVEIERHHGQFDLLLETI